LVLTNLLGIVVSNSSSKIYLFSSLFSVFVSLAGASRAISEDEHVLEPVVVSAEGEEKIGTKTVPSNKEAKKIIETTPGGVAIVDSERFEDRYSLNFEDTLALTPGVYAQKRFGEEVRIAIRGSGLSRGFHLRGLTLLQDGIPFNLADNSADFQEADSLAYQRIEVFKGANGLQYGGTTLGGAINMVSKTGHSQSGDQLRMEIGSNATFRTNIQTGRVFDTTDFFLSATGTSSDGFRQHEDQENIKLNSNIGAVLSDSVETRFYISGNVIDQELPGSVTLSTALDSPERADPSSITQDWARDIRSVRVSNKTTIDIGADDTLDVGAFVNAKDLYHPITAFVGVIDQESLDYGVFAQASGEYSLSEYRNRYRVGINSQLGGVDAKLYKNIGGNRGDLLSDRDQNSRNVTVYGENSFYLDPEFAVVFGGQLIWSDRELDDHRNSAKSDSEIFHSFNPKIGVLYEPVSQAQFFGNLSRSYEVPTFSELTQGGAAGFTPIDAQKGWTAEIGTRGGSSDFAWELSVYRAWLDGEMLQFTTGPAIPASTFNAKDTVHQGVELGFASRILENALSSCDSVTWRNAYTFSDYFFSDDLQYGDNRIAGQPRSFYQTELRYEHGAGWFTAIDLELASDADVDFANTLKAPGYGVVSLNGGYAFSEQIDLFIEGRNLLDRGFVSTFSTITDSTGNTAVFYPGDGRRVFGGIRVSW